jgi:hypothetical protein
MKLGLVGPSYQERSLPFDAQRTINFYPTIDETGEGKEVSALYGTPGLELFCTAGIGPIRGVFSSTNGRAFVVSATQLFEISIAGVPTLRGTLTSDLGSVSFDENTTQLAICDGTSIYILTYASNAFATPTLAASPAYTVTQLDGYFIYNTNAGQFYISGLQDGLSWNALDFATAESSPDGLIRVFSTQGQLWLLGSRTVEIWLNSADVDFPFARVQGARMEVGCAAAFSVVSADNTIFWLGTSKDGQGIVYRASGYTPQRISTFAIERYINTDEDLSNIRGYTYQQDGHLFYVLTGGNLETTICYDAATQQWHERANLEEDGTYSTHIATTCMFVFNKHLVGDKTNGNIYQMSEEFYSDAGNEIRAQRTFTHLNNEGKSFSVNTIQIDFEYGVGLISGQGSDPVVWLEISVDGGRTWGSELLATIGKMGAYKWRAYWNKLGYTENQMTFRVTITDPVKRAICGAYAF